MKENARWVTTGEFDLEVEMQEMTDPLNPVKAYMSNWYVLLTIIKEYVYIHNCLNTIVVGNKINLSKQKP